MTDLNCPLCGGTQSSLFDQRHFLGKEVINRKCSGCGLIFQSPRMSDDSLNRFYKQEYRQIYQSEDSPTITNLSVQQARAKSLLKFVTRRKKQVYAHLDIGCSTGKLLEQFRGEFDCRSVGIEPGDEYRNYALDQGNTVHPSIESLSLSEERDFDLISMVHVLEHISDPVQYLINLREEYLMPSGFLLIEVPNLFAHDSFEIAHLFSFSANTLSMILKKAGFEIIALRKHGEPRSVLIPLYITVLARPVVRPKLFEIHSDRGVRIKRGIGLFYRRVVSFLLPKLAWVPIASNDAKK